MEAQTLTAFIRNDIEVKALGLPFFMTKNTDESNSTIDLTLIGP